MVNVCLYLQNANDRLHVLPVGRYDHVLLCFQFLRVQSFTQSTTSIMHFKIIPPKCSFVKLLLSVFKWISKICSSLQSCDDFLKEKKNLPFVYTSFPHKPKLKSHALSSAAKNNGVLSKMRDLYVRLVPLLFVAAHSAKNVY